MVSAICVSPANRTIYCYKNLAPVVIIGVVLFNCFNRKSPVNTSN